MRKINKIATLVLTFLCVHFNAYAQSGTVSVNVKNETLKSVFNSIESQTDCAFFYSNTEVDDSRLVSVSMTGTVPQIIAVVLPDMECSVVNNKIILSPAKGHQKESPMVVSGRVADESGEPLIGAGVMLDGTTNGVVTDLDGKYSLEVVKGSKVKVSFIGYKDYVFTASDSEVVNVTMLPDNDVLDEVVVVGYGTASKRLVSSSIATVSMANVDRGASLDPMQILQGRVTGVNITSASGTPGAAPNVIVRGVSSVSGGSSPLYVVDGIPAEKYPAISSADIESMEVLKDASATAIYGSRANAGVIIITTKSGKKGKASVNINSQYGVRHVAHDIPMANTEEYTRVMQAAFDNYNIQKIEAKQFFIPSNAADFDWLAAISNRLASTTSNNVSLSGGSESLDFYVSAGFDSVDGYIKNTGYQNWTGRAKFGYKAFKWLKFNLNTAVSYSRQDKAEETSTSLKVIRTAREEQPWYTAYQDNGSYNIMTTTGLCRHNPVMLITEEQWWVDKYALSGTVSFDITPFKGFKYTPSASAYAILDYETKRLTENHAARAFNAGWAAITQQKDNSFRYVFDNVVSYTNKLDLLEFDVMAGHSLEKYTYDQFGFYSSNYANEAYPSSSLGLVTSGAEIFANDVGYSAYALESYFARLAANWDNKYILNLSFRSDGSSRFPKESRFGSFPAGSFAWIASNEPFMKNVPQISELKLRVSAGQTGSMAGIGNWDAMSLVSASGSYNGVSAFVVGTPAKNLKWEKATKFDGGVDLGLFDDRITANLDLYYSRTDDMLYNKPVIASTGMTSLTSNIGSAENKGIEFAINGKVFDGPFKWELGFNISHAANKLLYLLDDTEDIVVANSGSNLLGGVKHILKNGEPISSWYMYRFDGIYQRDEDVPAKLYAKGVRAGDCVYYDADGDGDITEDDRVLCGKATPDFFGGVNSTMSWKGFELSIFCTYSIGNRIMAAWKGVNGVEGTEHLGLASGTVNAPGVGEVTQYFNVSKQAANGFWDGEGTSNTIPRPLLAGVHTGYTYDYNVQTSTRYLEDASYFKVKTVTLSYNLPEKALKAIGSNGAKVFLTVDNALCFTKYDGYDPEASYHANPSHANYGVDFGLSPSMRSFIAGVQLKF